MIRLFTAIGVPADTAAALTLLAGGVPGARWSPAENLHITLRFAGEISETLADDLDLALGGVTAPRFSVSIAGVGSFADQRGVNALWAGVEPNDLLSRLRGRCESAARRAGLPPDTRVWKPHVTLAYISGGDAGRVASWTRSHALLRAPPFEAESFGLYSSRRGRSGGSVYCLERSYRLHA